MLIELLVASAMALVILTAVLALFMTSQKNATAVLVKADAVAAANIGLREMDQDLRNTYLVEFPTSTNNAGCPATSGVQPCNIIDVLVHSTSMGFTGSDFEIRYDCTVVSSTIVGDRACWRYLCSASATTPANSVCTATSTGLLSKKVVVDGLLNGTTIDPVFSFCYPSTSATGPACGAGAARPTSGSATVKIADAGTLASTQGGDPATAVLTSGLYMPNLDYNQ